MTKYNLKNDTMDESQRQKIYNHPIYPRDSEKYSDKGFAIIDNRSMGGSHWTCFIVEDKKSYYFDSYCGQSDELYLNNYLNQ